MAKYQDEVELLMSARDEQIDAMRKAEKNAIETERRQARREREAINRAKKQAGQRERIQKESYDKAEKNAAEGGRRVANAFESPLLKAALRSTAAFGSLELGVGGANALIGVMKGNLEGAAEAVKQLPAGIGPFARQLETLLGTVTGIGDEISRINTITANLDKASQSRAANALSDLRAQAAEFKKVRDLRQDTELRQTADPTAKQRRAEGLRASNAIAALNAEIAELGRKRSELSQKSVVSGDEIKQVEELKQKLESLEIQRKKLVNIGRRSEDSGAVLALDSEIKQIEQTIKSFDTRRNALRGEIENIERQIERVRARSAAVLENNAVRAAELEREIAQRQDEERQKIREEETRREAEAQKERLRLYEDAVKARKKFDQELARERRSQAIEANREQQEAIKQRRSGIEDDIARLRSAVSAPITQNTADQNRFLTGVSERSAQLDRQTADPQRQQLQVLEKQLDKLDMVEQKLENIEAELRNGARVVGGIFEGSN